MNAIFTEFVIYVKVITYLLLSNLHAVLLNLEVATSSPPKKKKKKMNEKGK